MFIAYAGVALAAFSQQPVSAPSSLDVATAYTQAYSDLDLQAMGQWLDEQTVFVDETWARNGNSEPEIHVGEAAFMAVLEDFMAEYEPLGLNFEWDYVFESNDRVVFSGWVNSRYATEDPDQLFQWRARQVTVLTVSEGQITHHRDFAAYETPEQGLVPSQ